MKSITMIKKGSIKRILLERLDIVISSKDFFSYCDIENVTIRKKQIIFVLRNREMILLFSQIVKKKTQEKPLHLLLCGDKYFNLKIDFN